MITQAIREASSSQEVYVLLTMYLNGAPFGSELMRLSREILAMKLTGMDAVKACTVRLFSTLQSVSKSLDDKSRVAVKEALYVFGAALDRLGSYETGRRPPAQLAFDTNSILARPL